MSVWNNCKNILWVIATYNRSCVIKVCHLIGERYTKALQDSWGTLSKQLSLNSSGAGWCGQSCNKVVARSTNRNYRVVSLESFCKLWPSFTDNAVMVLYWVLMNSYMIRKVSGSEYVIILKVWLVECLSLVVLCIS